MNLRPSKVNQRFFKPSLGRGPVLHKNPSFRKSWVKDWASYNKFLVYLIIIFQVKFNSKAIVMSKTDFGFWLSWMGHLEEMQFSRPYSHVPEERGLNLNLE